MPGLEPARAPRRVCADRPRERLDVVGAAALSDAELVALVLRTGRRGHDALDVSSHLLARHGGLRGLARAGSRELARSAGVGPAKSGSVLAALEIGRRLCGRPLQIGVAIRSPADVYRHFRARLSGLVQEHFWVVLLDARNRVLRTELVSQGTLTASLVHPREVFRPALREAAAALVLVHNHPSGDPAPSPEDREVTERLFRAGELLGVRVLDHVIVAERGFFSMSEDGERPSQGSSAPSRRPAGLAGSAKD